MKRLALAFAAGTLLGIAATIIADAAAHDREWAQQ